MPSIDIKKINWDFLTTIKGVISLLRDPGKTDSVYDIEDGLRHIKANQVILEHLRQDPSIAQIIAERYVGPPVDLEYLSKLPEESLGYAYASYIKSLGFDPNFYRPINIEDDVSYLLLRMRQTHDIWHVVSGFKTNVAGELQLKAFELAQNRRIISLILVAGGVLGTLFKSPEQLDALIDQIALGYRMGREAKPLLAQKWEEQWEKPLSQWRAELGINPSSVA